MECNVLLEQSYSGSLPSNEKCTMNTCINDINSDSSERKYVHLCSGLIQSFEICYTFFKYEYAQVTVDLFCKNVTLVYCLVVVCNYVLLFFLCLKECVIILKFGSTVSCGLTRETRLSNYKPIAWRMHLLDCMKCSTLDGDPFIRWALSGEN